MIKNYSSIPLECCNHSFNTREQMHSAAGKRVYHGENEATCELYERVVSVCDATTPVQVCWCIWRITSTSELGRRS